MNKSIAAVTVLYNPQEVFIKNIYSYSNRVSLLILIDNSENPSPALYDCFKNDPTIKIIFYHSNNGIAKALNDAVRLAAANGFDWILTMDQDSWFERKDLENYLAAFAQLPNKEKTAVVGPEFENKNTSGIKKVISVITSGSLVNIKAFGSIGGFNEDLFIDEVDHEYCYRAILDGYAVLQIQQGFLQHSLGNLINVTTISGKKNKAKALHAPIRLYYIVRNSLYVISRYKNSFPAEMNFKRKDVLIRIKNNLFYGKHKLSILRYVVRGYIDYKKNRMGKYRD